MVLRSFLESAIRHLDGPNITAVKENNAVYQKRLVELQDVSQGDLDNSQKEELKILLKKIEYLPRTIDFLKIGKSLSEYLELLRPSEAESKLFFVDEGVRALDFVAKLDSVFIPAVLKDAGVEYQE